jgi:hypothetical protein
VNFRKDTVPRHDRDAGGPADVLAAKADLRHEVWSAMRAAKVARFPGAEGRIPNFTGAEAAAERLAATPEWRAAGTIKSNPDSAQLPVRQYPGNPGCNPGHVLGTDPDGFLPARRLWSRRDASPVP